MFCEDHNPPHFHAEYQEHEAVFDINTLEILRGDLPKRARLMVIEWALEHRKELLINWEKAQIPQKLDKIEPLG